MQSPAVVKLSSGHDMPLVGYGTFLSGPGEVGAALKEAIKAGYRHIDCAAVYKNEAEIGAALAELFFKKAKLREKISLLLLNSQLVQWDPVELTALWPKLSKTFN